MADPTTQRVAAALDIAKAAGVQPGLPYQVLCEALGSPKRIAAALELAAVFDEWDSCLEGGERRRAIWVEKVGPAKAAYRATAPKPSKVYDWSRVPAALWAALAHECCADDRWENMRPELVAAVQAVQAAADQSRSAQVHLNPLVRITWQCGSCGWGYFGPLQEVCPGCSAEGFWSGSVASDCKPWPGYPCAAAPGVKVAPLPTPARVQLLEEIADDLVDMLDGEPSGSDSLDWALERYGYKPTKGVPAEPECTEEASPEPTAGKICVRCGQQVEAERACYVIPHCLQCLPAPEPIPVRQLERVRAEAAEASTSELVRSLQEGNKFLQDQLVAANAARRLRLAEIYHLTITYGDDPAMALLAIRNASGPGS